MAVAFFADQEVHKCWILLVRVNGFESFHCLLVDRVYFPKGLDSVAEMFWERHLQWTGRDWFGDVHPKGTVSDSQ